MNNKNFLSKILIIMLLTASLSGTVYALTHIPIAELNSTSFNEAMKKYPIANKVHSFLYRLLGKNEIDNFQVVRDKDGNLYNSNFWNNTDISMMNAAQKIRGIQDIFYEEKTGEVTTRVMVLLFPGKYEKERTNDYAGLPYPDMNAYADDFLQYLRRYSIDFIDYRQWLKESGRSTSDAFYLSDSHWRVNTAFYATEYLVEYIKYKYGLDMDPDHIYLNSENYTKSLYEKVFYGDYALKTELYHTEADSYELMTPDFPTEFETESESPNGKISREHGIFSDVLTTRRYINEDSIYDREVYKTYLGSVHTKFHIKNALAPDGQRFLFIWDVWSPEMAAFTATMTGTVDSFNILYMNDQRIKKELNENSYDYIFIGLQPDTLNSSYFPYEFRTKEGEDQNE